MKVQKVYKDPPCSLRMIEFRIFKLLFQALIGTLSLIQAFTSVLNVSSLSQPIIAGGSLLNCRAPLNLKLFLVTSSLGTPLGLTIPVVACLVS